MLDPRGQVLRAAVGFAGCSMPSYDRALWALRSYLDSWDGIGRVAVGMHRQGYDLQLTQYDEHGWRATFFTMGMELSPVSAIGTSWEKTPWRAVQRAAWGALRRASTDDRRVLLIGGDASGVTKRASRELSCITHRASCNERDKTTAPWRSPRRDQRPIPSISRGGTLRPRSSKRRRPRQHFTHSLGKVVAREWLGDQRMSGYARDGIARHEEHLCLRAHRFQAFRQFRALHPGHDNVNQE